MARISGLLTKIKSIIRKGPATLRNIVYARLGIWPVSNIAGSDLAAIPTYCINLSRTTGRRVLMLRQARDMGLLDFKIVDAIDSMQLNREQLIKDKLLDDEETLNHHDNTLTINEIACSLSHRKAYEQIVKNQDDAALILEDDALYISRFARNFSLSQIPKDFDVMFLNTFLLNEPPHNKIAPNIFDDTSYGGSSCAYIVSANGARKLLAASTPVIHAADGLLGRNLAPISDQTSSFRGRGANTTIKGYIHYPDCILNGSVCHYHVSDVQ